MAAPTFDELYDIFKAEAQLRRSTVQFRPGDLSDMLAAGSTAQADVLIGYTAERVKATFVDGAIGEDLTILANDHWGIVRNPASYATGTVTFTPPGVVTATIPSGTTLATVQDALGKSISFTTTAELNFTASSAPQDVAVIAVVSGLSGNVAAGTITQILDTLTESFTVTNAALTAGGAVEESDAALRERIRLYPSTLRRGTLAALEYGAKTVAGVARATAAESLTGLATVYVSDDSGGSSSGMVALVTAEIENWRAAGSVVTVVGGALLEVDIDITLTVRSGTDPSQLIDSVIAAATARLATHEIGETLYRSSIAQAVRNVDSRSILEATITMRTGANPFAALDIAPGPGEIIRAGSVSVV